MAYSVSLTTYRLFRPTKTASNRIAITIILIFNVPLGRYGLSDPCCSVRAAHWVTSSVAVVRPRRSGYPSFDQGADRTCCWYLRRPSVSWTTGHRLAPGFPGTAAPG